jgi:hypothetical protein
VTDAPATPAKLAYITNPTPGEFVFNVQNEGGELHRYRLNHDQLFALNAKSADVLLRAFK